MLSTTAPNILTIGDSISMCGYGYGHFVNDMLVQQTGGTLAGYSSACGTALGHLWARLSPPGGCVALDVRGHS